MSLSYYILVCYALCSDVHFMCKLQWERPGSSLTPLGCTISPVVKPWLTEEKDSVVSLCPVLFPQCISFLSLAFAATCSRLKVDYTAVAVETTFILVLCGIFSTQMN